MNKTNFTYNSNCGGLIYDYWSCDDSPHVTPHTHDFYELYFFLEGDAIYSVEGNIYELSSNDILFTNSRELHSPIFNSNSRYSRALIFVKPNYLAEYITNEYNPFSFLEQRKLGQQNKIDSTLVKTHELDKKMDIIDFYSRNSLPMSNLMIKTTIAQIVTIINEIITNSEKKYHKSGEVQKIIEYINKNLKNDLSLEIIKNQFHHSKFYIAHIFKAQTGYSIGQYISRKRILLAKDLLMNKIPVMEIAYKVGFKDYSNFYKTFKSITGHSPKQFTKKL